MFYVVADGTAYVMDHADDTPYGCDVRVDGSIDFDSAFDFDPRMDEEDLEYTAHILHHLKQIAQLTEEHSKVFVKWRNSTTFLISSPLLIMMLHQYVFAHVLTLNQSK